MKKNECNQVKLQNSTSQWSLGPQPTNASPPMICYLSPHVSRLASISIYAVWSLLPILFSSPCVSSVASIYTVSGRSFPYCSLLHVCPGLPLSKLFLTALPYIILFSTYVRLAFISIYTVSDCSSPYYFLLRVCSGLPLSLFILSLTTPYHITLFSKCIILL